MKKIFSDGVRNEETTDWFYLAILIFVSFAPGAALLALAVMSWRG